MIRIHQGIDLVDIARFREVADRHEAFLADIFTEEEQRYCSAQKDAAVHFAGRFAAKEACLKALGIGIASGGMGRSLRDIEVTRKSSGSPELSLHGWAALVSRRKKIRQQTVSISHTGSTAAASVVMVAEGGSDAPDRRRVK